MTGLDIKRDHIIEIACIITDKDLHVVAESDDIVVNQPAKVMDAMGDWCKEHHGKSGLTEAVLKSAWTTESACESILQFIKRHVPERGVGILAGNSIHSDRMFLNKEMEPIVEWLHYRIVDVSTVKELARRWNFNVFSTAPKKKIAHRALDDIRESIEELRHYKSNLFKS